MSKFFEKVKLPGGMREIRICGRTILRYRKRKHRELPADVIRNMGVQVGERTRFVIYPKEDSYPELGSEPFLISIGEDCLISFGVTFLTHDGSIAAAAHAAGITQMNKFGRIRIGNNCFIGCHTIIMPGVTIGNDCIIGAGSVVTRSIPDGEVWAGNPARFIKKTIDLGTAQNAYSSTPEHQELMQFVAQMKSAT